MDSRNRWRRAVVAGVLAEVALILCIAAAVIGYRQFASDMSAIMDFAHMTSAWMGLTLGPLFTVLLARWALRPLTSAHMRHALVVGMVAVTVHALHAWDSVAQGEVPVWMFAAALLLIPGAAVAAGMLAKRSPTPVQA